MEPLKLDLGCGKNKREGFVGVDCIKFDTVDVVADLTQKWPFEDNSVDEVFCSHFIEHLEATQRIHFANELYRVLKPGCKATLVAPDWSNDRAYGDMTHKWPPVSGFWFFYLSKEWRATNAPHDDIQYNPNGYNCNFEAGWGHSLRQDVVSMNEERKIHHMSNYKNVCMDLIATLTKR